MPGFVQIIEFRTSRIKEIEELNIGHSIVSRAIRVGLKEAVREMKQLMTTYPQGPCD